jgi:hypothetical protein
MAARGGIGNAGVAGDWDLLFGDAGDARAKAAALAQALRGQQGDALALQAVTGGYRAAPQIGATLAANAQAELGGIGQAAGERLRMAIQQRHAEQQAGQQQAQLTRQERAQAETERHNRAVEARPVQSPLTVVTGEGGQLFYANPRSPQQPVQPLLGPGGLPVMKPKQQKVLQTGDKKTIDELTGEIDALGRLEGQFKPEFAGGGPLGGFATSMYSKLGSAGTQGMQQDAAFWADFNRLIDLPQRNAVFGASLSTGEKSSWEGAKNIKPGSSPDLVKAKLAEMRGIMSRKLGNVGSSLEEEGYDAGAISKRSGGLYGGAPAQAGTAAGKVDPAARMAQLRGEGKSKDEAVAIMMQEGH